RPGAPWPEGLGRKFHGGTRLCQVLTRCRPPPCQPVPSLSVPREGRGQRTLTIAGSKRTGGGMTDIARLPKPTLDVWEWQFEGHCRQVSPEVFFHPEGERGSQR